MTLTSFDWALLTRPTSFSVEWTGAKASSGQTVTTELDSISDTFDFARDYLGLLKAAVIAAGIVPPGLEGCRHTIAGNRTRFRDVTDVREDLAWKAKLSPRDLAVVKRRAGAVADCSLPQCFFN